MTGRVIGPWLSLMILVVMQFIGKISGQHGIKTPAPTRESSPFVITTWAFDNATAKAWDILNNQRGTALDAVEEGCSLCEVMQCNHAVGYGSKPDENGETTLDAMIMDGTTRNVGAVGALRRVKSAISVARMVLEHTDHTLLVGDQATDFAVMMGFKEENLTTSDSAAMYENWKNGSCQPNFWVNVVPDPSASCGPYLAVNSEKYFKQSVDTEKKDLDIHNHDTIGMIAIDINGHIASGTSTNGLRSKIPGRVGDSPIPGSGAYADKYVGGAVATGNGDIMMRFMPTFMTVEGMRSGLGAQEAAEVALLRIASYYPDFKGAIVATNIVGEFGVACYGYTSFPYSLANVKTGTAILSSVDCIA